MSACCPDRQGHTITDPQQHSTWHGLVLQQVGPLLLVDVQSLRIARGMGNDAPPARTLIDTRKRTGRRT